MTQSARPWTLLALAAAAAAAWRLPFARLPITTDEAGYVTVARLWAHGGRLYQSVWVDRPQGLLLVFRVLVHFGGTVLLLRATAAVAGALLVLLIAAVGYELGGRPIAVTAALCAGVIGCSPFLESFTLSGELLAAVPAVAAAYCGARWIRRGGSGWVAAAGLLCGCAVLVKQSAFDSGLALVALIALRGPRRRPLLMFASAFAAPVLVAVLTAPSARDWWFAVVTYRLRGEGFVHGVSSLSAGEVLGAALPVVAGLGLLLALGLRGLGSSPLFVRLWVVASAVGAIGGGLFHAHYYIELVPPLSLASAYALERMRRERRRFEPAAAAVLAAASVAVALFAVGSPIGRQTRLFFPRDAHLVHDAAVARAAAGASHRRSAILVLPPIASIVYLAKRNPAIPYLWARNIETIRAAALAERSAILHERAATLVFERSPGYLRAVGLSMTDITTHYRAVATTGGATVYRARG